MMLASSCHSSCCVLSSTSMRATTGGSGNSGRFRAVQLMRIIVSLSGSTLGPLGYRSPDIVVLGQMLATFSELFGVSRQRRKQVNIGGNWGYYMAYGLWGFYVRLRSPPHPPSILIFKLSSNLNAQFQSVPFQESAGNLRRLLAKITHCSRLPSLKAMPPKSR